MLRSIELDHFNHLQTFIKPRAANAGTLAEAQATAKANIPTSFSDSERTALNRDIDQATTNEQVLEAYLAYVGVKTVKRVFP